MAPISSITELASAQEGYFTRAQAHELGIDDAGLRRALLSSRLSQPHRGVYRFAGAPIHSHEKLWAAWMGIDPIQPLWEKRSNPHALVFGPSALAVFGVGSVPSSLHSFAVDRLRRTRHDDTKLFHRKWVRKDFQLVQGMAVARIEWCIAELHKVGLDPTYLNDVLRDARWRNLIDEDYLQECIDTSKTPSKAPPPLVDIDLPI
ncbi:MAG: type IV toxin-antitoxin system AbiEi family antitoxin domain-containing protein [Acidimicrobiaceae bacterium]|nr:type IV toxin-antitoxin system AbiEi family antitoxin domain-containing protein [Acidimicrobiaceae bacterium]